MAAADQIRSLYREMPARLARARSIFGRPLTLAEKILASHCWDLESQAWERGKAILRLRVDRVESVGGGWVDCAWAPRPTTSEETASAVTSDLMSCLLQVGWKPCPSPLNPRASVCLRQIRATPDGSSARRKAVANMCLRGGLGFGGLPER